MAPFHHACDIVVFVHVSVWVCVCVCLRPCVCLCVYVHVCVCLSVVSFRRELVVMEDYDAMEKRCMDMVREDAKERGVQLDVVEVHARGSLLARQKMEAARHYLTNALQPFPPPPSSLSSASASSSRSSSFLSAPLSSLPYYPYHPTSVAEVHAAALAANSYDSRADAARL